MTKEITKTISEMLIKTNLCNFYYKHHKDKKKDMFIEIFSEIEKVDDK